MVANDLEHERERWAKIAKRHGWYSEPFYVQVWIDADGTITDSVSVKGMSQDYILTDDSEDYDG